MKKNLAFFFLSAAVLVTAKGFSEIKEKAYVKEFRYSGVTPLYKTMDIYHPTREDYEKIESFIRGNGWFYKNFRDYQKNAQNVRFFGVEEGEVPKKEIVVMNTTADDKECCIVSYASYNKNYTRGQQRIKQTLEELGYKGHFFYRTGGWPDLESGSLKTAHLVYTFKPAMMREAARMGYKKVLWLDCSIIPVTDLENIFQIIEEKGLFVFGGYHPIGPYTSEACCSSFGIDFQSTFDLPTFSSGIFGLDLTSKLGKRVLHEWSKAARSEVRWVTSRPDQSCLSIILHLLGVDFWVDRRLRANSINQQKDDSLFVVDRAYVNERSGKII